MLSALFFGISAGSGSAAFTMLSCFSLETIRAIAVWLRFVLRLISMHEYGRSNRSVEISSLL